MSASSLRIVAPLLLVLAPAAARAGGVPFPNTQAVLVPADRPGDIWIPGTIGIVASHDGGRTWTWSCEPAPAANAFGHRFSPAPRDRLFALAGPLIYSDDGACGWQTAGGLLAGNSAVTALFTDPTNADRVLAAAYVSDGGGDGGVGSALFESGDGGTTFDTVRYTSAGVITSVASAASDAATIYLTIYAAPPAAPTLLRSGDGGSSWAPVDLGNAIGAGRLDILAVDPVRADKLYLRSITAADESLVVVDGATVTRPIQLATGGGLTAFLRASDGTLLAAGVVWNGTLLYRSGDGGASFAAIAGAPHINGLAERGGIVYAATDPGRDGFAEATSLDDGATWQPGLRYDQVEAIAACLEAVCQTECAFWADQYLWPATVCSADPTPGDAGADGSLGGVRDGSPEAGSDASADAVVRDGPVGGHDSSLRPRGCRCGLSPDRPGGSWAAAAAAFALAGRRRRRRRRQTM